MGMESRIPWPLQDRNPACAIDREAGNQKAHSADSKDLELREAESPFAGGCRFSSQIRLQADRPDGPICPFLTFAVLHHVDSDAVAGRKLQWHRHRPTKRIEDHDRQS